MTSNLLVKLAGSMMSNPFRPCRMVARRVTAISAIDIPMFCFCQFGCWKSISYICLAESMINWAVYLWLVSCSTYVFLTNHWMHCQTSNNQFFFPPPNFSVQISIFGSGRTWVPWLNHWIFLDLLGGKIRPSFFSTDHATAMWVLEKQVRVRDGLISICLIFSDSVMMLR